jgi:hypothetical protein
MNLTPRGEVCPPGGMFTPSFIPRGEHFLLFRRMEGQTEHFTPRGLIHPQGTKCTPGGEVKNRPLCILFTTFFLSFLIFRQSSSDDFKRRTEAVGGSRGLLARGSGAHSTKIYKLYKFNFTFTTPIKDSKPSEKNAKLFKFS